jgi:hypothetical protein
MATTTAHVPTKSGSKYLQQLCKHWSHNLEVEFDASKGIVHLPGAVATMTALPEELTVSLEGEDAEAVEKMKHVVAVHLDRYAFREAPLPFEWS